MQLYLTKRGKDGAIYEKDAEELSLRGCRRDKKHVVSKNKEYVSVFSLVNSSLHLDIIYSILHASGIEKNKTHSEYSNDSKEVYSLCVAPPTPMNQEKWLRDEGRMYPLGFTQARL